MLGIPLSVSVRVVPCFSQSFALPLALILVAVRTRLSARAMLLVVLVLALILVAIGPRLSARTVLLTVLPLALVLVAIGPRIGSIGARLI